MNEALADRLARMRRDQGMSQEELANSLGVSRQAVSKWERGESSPDTGNLIALSDLFDVTIDELVRGSSDEPGAATDAGSTAEPAAADAADGVAKAEAVATTLPLDVVPAAALAAPANEAASQDVPAPAPATAPAAAASYPPPTAAPFPYAAPADGAPAAPAGSSSAEPRRKGPPSTFPYPVFVAILYLCLGFLFGLWHPGWLLFLTIPLYYWAAKTIEADPVYRDNHRSEEW
ncbi:helix-turn-helix domain-containing protein [Xiamenia xianingshaonis]|uniref:Helix-turn-helix domain-containing protein n=1 Tax=Xiamenia xianingshaonis TaxID=2682776 RepID=A0A9E6MRN6_9ACTN|nr:helix-turn-helix transcriptional regulator [Xiamenia xianingshaonis]NHM13442.1 helix-turn-helix domain-containing protein [Xiamenia xianingshaonis]QTU84481.1 helix-turn-helix transcriptional regulator [Xiamenia xianingshaonis]